MKTQALLALALFPTASTFVARSMSIWDKTALGFSAKGLFRSPEASSAAVSLTKQYAPQAVVSRIVVSILYCWIRTFTSSVVLLPSFD
jgi:hypothetical protein